MAAKRISQLEYEGLTARFFELMPRVWGASSLLTVVFELLEAEVAILIRRDPYQPGKTEVLEACPADRRNWANQNIGTLREWYGEEEPAEDIPGGSREKDLNVGNQKFPDALVAFGGLLPRNKPHSYELTVLQSGDAKHSYSSYHCAIAAALLRYFEQLDKLKRVRKAKKTYAGLLSLDVLREYDWYDFMQSVRKADTNKIDQADFMGPAAVLAFAYDIWGRSRLSSEEDKIKPQPWLQERSKKKGWSLYYKLAKCLAEPEALDESTVNDVLKSTRKIDDEAWKAALIILEHGWRLVFRATAREASAPEQIYIKDYKDYKDKCTALLRLTSELAARDLEGRKEAENPGTPLGRDSLRLYFAVLLCGARRLRERYLWLAESSGRDHRRVAKEVHREFLLNLARFMLGVVGILQKRSQVAAEPGLVSAVEVLDGLLYMIDRFAHVELQVDERLHIREYLGRGLAAEIHRHLGQRFYRDHLIHVIDVFILGHLLLSAQACWAGDRDQMLVDYIASMPLVDTSQSGSDKQTGLWLRDWAVAALLHDIGYQLIASPSGLDDGDAADRFFELPRPAGMEWVDMCSARTPWQERLGKFASGCCGNDNQSGWLPECETYGFTDHGVLSALRVAQILAHADCEGRVQLQNTDLPLVGTYRNSLHAIAHHNLFNHSVRFKTHPLSCLLRLCDELQEWGRRRVNIEYMVKHLYLQIEQNQSSALESHESLDWLDANLRLETGPNRGLTIRIDGQVPVIDFGLTYSNPVKAQYDAITTFLSKAYNLQHVELISRQPEESEGLEWRLLMRFPRPAEYLGLTELDIYGLLRERVRVLPELWRFNNPEAAKAGLVWLTDKAPFPELRNTDCLAIIVKGVSCPENRYGWQTCDPGNLRSNLIDLKRQLLTRRALGHQQGLTIWPET